MTLVDYLKNGSGIHIKKKNRGKFTDYCGGKVTEECIQKGKHSPSAAIRKRATFAANARTWKHQTGGRVYFNAKENYNEGLDIVDPRKEQETQVQQQTTATPKTEESMNWIEQMTKDLDSSASTVIVQQPPTEQQTQQVPKGNGPRGYRNNNPLNIRISNNPWSGKVAENTDGAFELFVDMAHGYRAGLLNMRTQINRGNNTIRKLISVWAPASDNNNPEKYANQVAAAAGMSVDDVINPKDPNTMLKIVLAMAKVENGQDANPDDVAQGWKLYMGSTL